jgi:hypothetical protein
MSQLERLDVDVEKAKQIWNDYERTHDLSAIGHVAVGIDPRTGEIHFGESAKAITLRLVQEGRNTPLFFRWVDNPYYTRKGGRR